MKSKVSNSALLSAFAAFNNKVHKKKTLKRLSSSSTSQKYIESSAKTTKKRKLGSKDEDRKIDIEAETLNVTKNKPVPCGNVDAEKCFEWLITPVSTETFFDEVWEKKPLHIRRQGVEHYKAVFSCKDFDKILRENHLEFNKNIDIVSYVNGERKTLNPDGRAYAPVVWDFYQQTGCSVRFLNPQTYSKTMWRLNSLLQEYFGSFVGANMYLTPPASQGFAPHYDDIEAFILQLEGKKQWKVYPPRSQSEDLPRCSSANFAQDEIGTPIMEIELQPGDLLYFPRGYIHQAKTIDNEHSLHITLSTYQRNTWGDLLELMLPRALSMAIEEDIEFRRSLPKDYMNYVGVANSDKDCPERDAFLSKVIHLTKRLAKYLPTDSAADQKAREYVHSSLPPCLSQKEKGCSIHGNGEFWVDGKVQNAVEIHPDTEVRLIRKRALRLVMEDDSVRLYHTLENSRVYQERGPQFVELGAELAPAMEHLFNCYPDFARVEELPLENLEQQMDIANLLYDKGLLITKDPLVAESDTE